VSKNSFAELDLHANLIKSVASLGYSELTPIQAQSLPKILAGKDLIGQGKTGSGKTAAFGLGVLQKLDVKLFRVQTLVLCPTRELADQVAKEVRKLARMIHNIKILTLCGGAPFGPQLGSLEHGAHIIVGTPGRVEEHLRKGSLKLDHLTSFVLDEADRMLDMGFLPSLDAIVEYLPAQRQTLLFSATYPDQIKTIADRIMRSPEFVKVESTHKTSDIRQHFFEVERDERKRAVHILLSKYRPSSTVVFCNTKKETQEVADYLSDEGFEALALNGDLDQRDRDRALVRFANKSISVLVATDVAARGLDIEGLDLVINYHISREEEVHVHRIGRTGRAGNQGVACTLVESRERFKIGRLEALLGTALETEALPSETFLQEPPFKSSMATFQIDGGKKQKVRPGDILGALTGKQGVAGDQVGKIHVFDNCAYVAVQKSVANFALKKLNEGKLKGRTFRVRRIRG